MNKILSLFLNRYEFARFVLSRVPYSVLDSIGKKKAYKTFKKALSVEAYKKFLDEKKFDPDSVDSPEDFSKIPSIDKASYISKYGFEECSKDDDFYLVYRSSGYSGTPTYWAQDREELTSFVDYMDFNMKNSFDIHKKKTLIISTFALSSWVTGQQVLAGLSQVASKHSGITYFVCGMNTEEPLDIIKRFGSMYEQILIFAYPLTFKTLIDQSEEIGVNLKEYNIFGIIGGEGITYRWSKYFGEKLSPEGDTKYRIYSAFGAADTGIGVASEQMASLVLKDLVFENEDLRKELTGNGNMPLHMFQYSPLSLYIEEEEGDLIFTTDKQIPLVRYNLHDQVVVLSPDKVESVLSKFGFDIRALVEEHGAMMFNLPFLVIYGRSDDTLIINAANIYISSFKEALGQKDIADLHTGKFYVEKVEEEDMFHNFKISIELVDGILGSKYTESELKDLFRDKILEFMLAHDKGFSKAYYEPYGTDRQIGIIEFTNFNDTDRIKHKYS